MELSGVVLESAEDEEARKSKYRRVADPEEEEEEESSEEEEVVTDKMELDGGGSGQGVEPKKVEEIEATNAIIFSPPLYIQRYVRTSRILEEYFKSEMVNPESKCTILEFGCAEFKMLTYLKRFPCVEKLVFIDKDQELLEEKKFHLTPLPFEHLSKRETPLTVQAYAGCVTVCDPRILQIEPKIAGIIAIELVEHLHPQVLAGFEITTFGLLAPPIVIVTTPNSDFNVVFDLPPGKFRHWDHKFEWSRSEFEDWCTKIGSTYDYTFQIEGVGIGPEDTSHLGSPSQLVTFRKIQKPLEKLRSEIYSDIISENAYTLISSIEYPFFVDPRGITERIVDEFTYFRDHFILRFDTLQDYWYDEVKTDTFPLDHILDSIRIRILKPGEETDSLPDAQIIDALKGAGFEITKNPNESHSITLKLPTEEEYYGGREESPDEDEEVLSSLISEVSLAPAEDEEEWT